MHYHQTLGTAAVWPRSLTSFEMTDRSGVSFRVLDEKSFFDLQYSVFKLHHYQTLTSLVKESLVDYEMGHFCKNEVGLRPGAAPSQEIQ
jgi:hypothetical protein